MAWTKFWAAKRQFTARAASAEARLQRLRAEVLPAMTWGSAASHLRPDINGVAEKALVRMTKLVLHHFRPEGEPWLDWHIRTSRCARERLSSASWDRPAAVIVACAVSGTTVLIARPECPKVGIVIHWRSAAGREAMSHLSGVRLGPWSRHVVDRPRRRGEDPLCQLASCCWCPR